jgi:hypothetical protein
MFKKLIGPGILAIAGIGVVGGVSHAASAIQSGSTSGTTTTSTQTRAQATPTVTTRSGCPHDSHS